MASLLTQARRALLGLTDTEKSLLDHFGSPDHAEVLTQHAQVTQATHAQVASQPPGPLSTGARSSKPPAPTALDLHCWAKFVPAGIDRSEFGFDWVEWQRAMPFTFQPSWLPSQSQGANTELTKVMNIPIANFEYCYDTRQQRYLPVSHDAHLKAKLQGEYQRLSVYGEDYFAGWLSMQPGQEINLLLYIEALNTAPAQGDYLTFAAHASYQVTVNEQVNEAIRIPLQAHTTAANPQGVLLTIKCLHACTSTALRVLDEKGVVVGQLNVVDNTKTYLLPVRVIYLVKDGPGAAKHLADLQHRFESLDLLTYLNQHSLNQAHIKVAFERTNHVHQLVFKEAEWAGKYYDVAHQWLTDYTETIGRQSSRYFLLEKVIETYRAKYEKPGTTPFRGILLVMTNLNKDPADKMGGVSRVRPVEFREAIVYGSNLTDQETYAHELAHALGLDHTFIDENARYELERLRAELHAPDQYTMVYASGKKYYAENIAASHARITAMQADLASQPAYYAAHPAESQALKAKLARESESLKELKKASRDNEAFQEKHEKERLESEKSMRTFPANPYKFKQNGTTNFMDYTPSPMEKQSFFHWQWQVMQNDVTRYYGK